MGLNGPEGPYLAGLVEVAVGLKGAALEVGGAGEGLFEGARPRLAQAVAAVHCAGRPAPHPSAHDTSGGGSLLRC